MEPIFPSPLIETQSQRVPIKKEDIQVLWLQRVKESGMFGLDKTECIIRHRSGKVISLEIGVPMNRDAIAGYVAAMIPMSSFDKLASEEIYLNILSQRNDLNRIPIRGWKSINFNPRVAARKNPKLATKTYKQRFFTVTE